MRRERMQKGQTTHRPVAEGALMSNLFQVTCLVAVGPRNKLLRQLDTFDTDALINAFGANQPPPSVCDLNEAYAVLRELSGKQASLHCHCNLEGVSTAALAIVPVGKRFHLCNSGAPHAIKCPFSKIPGRTGMRIVTPQLTPGRQASSLALAALAGDQVSYLHHNLIATITPSSQRAAA